MNGFKNIIAISELTCIALMLWKDRQKGSNFFPDRWWFAASMGTLGGFATMIGNVAGPIFAILFTGNAFSKKQFYWYRCMVFSVLSIYRNFRYTCLSGKPFRGIRYYSMFHFCRELQPGLFLVFGWLKNFLTNFIAQR